ncbi:MAG: FkbM family methyltransferase, partial [Actinomycetota bacterium]|nr:FkbM family methyltransferase [Actinomycetota bacterium]
MRAELVRAVDRLGVGAYLRRAQSLVDPNTRRARRDDEHLRLLLAFVLSSGSNCIDVGCHKGAVLSEMVHLAPEGHHIAYEPLPHLAEKLRRAFPTVDVRNAALSDASGESTFVHVTTRPDYSGLRARPHPGAGRSEEIRVQMEDLDSHLPPGYVPTLIKIDVEG